MGMVNAYEILGLPTTASLDEIKLAYRAKARLFHPDSGGKAEHFLAVHRAFETLSDAQLREREGSVPQFDPLPLRIIPSLSESTTVLFENLNQLRDKLPRTSKTRSRS